MAVQNSLRPAGGNAPTTFSAYMKQDAVKKYINGVLSDPKAANNFMTSIVTAVNTNPTLKDCANSTIVSGALLGFTLNLSPSPTLGQYYLVPFEDKERGKVATFQLGYKGFIQLAIRSGQYKKLNVLAIKEGELVKYDPLDEEIEINLIEDFNEREKAETIGYYAMLELVNGFRKSIYWSKERMQAHAKKYSPGYRKDLNKGTTYTFWSKDFDAMAYKTMLRQLISKWGVMSIDLQKAYEGDQAVINQDGSKEYVEDAKEFDYIDPAEGEIKPVANESEETEPEEKKTAKKATKKPVEDNPAGDPAAALFD
jgi:recombination protein RecT